MLKNMKIKPKLLASFAIVMVLLIVSMAVSIVFLVSLSNKMNTFTGKTLPVINAVWTGRRAMVAVERAMYKAASNDDIEATKAQINLAQKELTSLEEVVVPAFQKLYLGDQSVVDKYAELMASTVETKEKVFELMGQNKNTEGLAMLENEYTPTFIKANEMLMKISDDVQARANTMAEESKTAQTVSTIVLIAIGAAALAVSVVICLLLTASITGPLAKINDLSRELHEGNLKANIKYDSKNEIGEVAKNLNESLAIISGYINVISDTCGLIAGGNLRDVEKHADFNGEFKEIQLSVSSVVSTLSKMMMQMRHASDQVSSGATQVSSGAQALSQGATEQASSIEELSATISDISTQVKDSATNAAAASAKASNVGVEISQSKDQMDNMIAAMSDISGKSNEISKIIKTIEDIAFQTNILALNAAVEAARAGTAGKGFAVVADEVRSLASKSAEAAKNTTALIESSIVAVQHGTQIADDTAASLASVVSGAKDVSETIQKVSMASNVQASAINQVTQGVEQISAVVQTNSATAEESAAASEELSGQATILNELVSRFKIRDDGGIDSESVSSQAQSVKHVITNASIPRQPMHSDSSKY